MKSTNYFENFGVRVFTGLFLEIVVTLSLNGGTIRDNHTKLKKYEFFPVTKPDYVFEVQ